MSIISDIIKVQRLIKEATEQERANRNSRPKHRGKPKKQERTEKPPPIVPIIPQGAAKINLFIGVKNEKTAVKGT